MGWQSIIRSIYYKYCECVNEYDPIRCMLGCQRAIKAYDKGNNYISSFDVVPIQLHFSGVWYFHLAKSLAISGDACSSQLVYHGMFTPVCIATLHVRPCNRHAHSYINHHTYGHTHTRTPTPTHLHPHTSTYLHIQIHTSAFVHSPYSHPPQTHVFGAYPCTCNSIGYL